VTSGFDIQQLAKGNKHWHTPCNEPDMLQYAITFFVVALVAALLGFWGLAGMAADIAKFLCLIFVVLMIVSLFRGRTPRL
jgi:uncharacterized membrane protein YtjA (UPF0391 family)